LGGVKATTGQVAIPLKYDDIGRTMEGKIPVKLKGKWGVINRNGKEVLPFNYDDIDLKEEGPGLYFVKLNQKCGVINTGGNPVVPLIYDEIGFFVNEGFIFVRLKNKWGLFNFQGQELASPKFDDYRPFSNGRAEVKENGRTYYIDTNGKELK
jgi:hypothetical protein